MSLGATKAVRVLGSSQQHTKYTQRAQHVVDSGFELWLIRKIAELRHMPGVTHHLHIRSKCNEQACMTPENSVTMETTQHTERTPPALITAFLHECRRNSATSTHAVCTGRITRDGP